MTELPHSVRGPIRAPRGNRLTAKTWLTEAPLRMLMNNLDPEVAERPEDLVVYGGIGKAARNWDCFDADRRRARAARRRRDAARPVGQAGRRLPHPRRRAARAARQLQPGAALGDLGALQRARPQGPDDVRPDDRRLVDLHRQPGHRAGHLRDLRRAGPPALSAANLRRALDPDRGPGRHGRRAAAGRDHGRRLAAGDRVPARPASTSASRPATSTGRRSSLDEALALHRRQRPDAQAALGAACSATPPRSCRSSLRRGSAARCGHRPDLRPRPVNGYLPGRLDVEQWEARSGPTRGASRPKRAPRWPTHVRAMLDFRRRGHSRRSTTATTSARWRSTQGVADAFDFPGFVPAYIRPLFCRGIGPFRWVGAVGRPGGHLQDRRQDEGAVPRRHRTCTAGSTWRGERIAFQGLPARICWIGLGERASRRPGVQRDGRAPAS